MMTMETLAGTQRSLVTAGRKPKDFLTATREKHVEASKMEVLRAAFHAPIDSHAADPDAVKGLHSYALTECVLEEHAASKTGCWARGTASHSTARLPALGGCRHRGRIWPSAAHAARHAKG
ncbi:hypothetical protein [Methylobacterium fujisawaense]|uniref:hypothetical protein n=1 Tax=Methylobacterium fujisawaense TaxID=107400 RepID=UPI002F35D2CA